jgi:hypothetical protein
MRNLILKRVASDTEATYGVLLTDGKPFAVTLERPWKGNAPRESCIPTGTYTCRRVQSPTFGNTFEVTGVKGRSHILFHPGNVPADSLGCILVGHGFDPVKGVHGVVSSKKEFAEFLALLAGQDECTLIVMAA